MKKELLILAASGWLGMSGFSATNYVDCTRPDDSGNGTSWATAKRTIQAAVNAVSAGDTVLVAPGTYNEGMTVTPGGYLSNRVVVTKSIALVSRDGASATVIQGARDPVDTTFQGCGSNAVRCVYMTAGTLKGFTLAGGATSSVNAQGVNERGGGLYGLNSSNPIIYDCIISNNASIRGGGAYMGAFHRCLFTGNYASMNGAATRGVRAYDCLIVTNFGPGTVAYSTDAEGIVNCTIARNSGTALDNSKAYNSIITENPAVANSVEPVFNCCVSSAPLASSNNIIAADARFVDSANGDFRLLVNSPCLNAANTNFYGTAGAAASRTDYSGNARLQGAGLDIGAIEGAAVNVAVVTSEKQGTGSGSIAPLGRIVLETLPTQLVFTATAGAGSVLRHFSVNGAKAYGTGTTFTLTVTLPGTYAVAAVFYPARYVNAAEGSDTNDGTTPATAWRTLQFAATNAAAGTLVLAAPGVYNEGVAYGASHSNRVSITRNIVLKSSAGPEQTFIVGAKDLVTGDANGRGPAAIRCVHMSAGALEGFTLTGGATNSGDTPDGDPIRGGGLYAGSSEVWDCVISNNVASRGSAIWGGSLHRCRLENNLCTGNGATRTASLYDCLIVNNRGLWAVSYECQLYNCTVSSNANGGVATPNRVYNSIIYGNAGTQVEAAVGITNSCMGGALRPGTGNISADPLFIDPASGDFRLQAASPCVNMGNVAYGTGADGTDLAGAKRVFGAQVDMGAYEENTGGVRILAGVSGGGTITPSGTLFWESTPMSQTFTAVPNPGRAFLYFSTNGIAIPNTGASLTLSSATDLSLSLLAHFSAGTFYADASRPDDSGDGASWASAKRTLQAAVDLTFDGDTVLVAPGTYNEGTRVTPTASGYLLNRVTVTNNITLRSRDGASATVIRGAFDTGSGDPYGRGPNAVRCVYLEKGTLQGFTLTGGATDSVNLENANNRGGGVYAADYNYLPLVLDCVISNNASVRGGGTHTCTLKRCVIRDNYASNNSSGVRGSYAYHCLITQNRAEPANGCAVGYAFLYNCTVADNQYRAGIEVTFYNCIIADQSRDGWHYDSCISGTTVGAKTNDNCFADAPLFADAANGDYRLSAGSPCLDRANFAYVDNRFGTDLAGAMRMQNAKVDLGAYEWDWRPTFAAALDGPGLAVTNVTPFVTYATNAAYVAGSAVYLDGHAAHTNQQAAVEMVAPWLLPPYSRTIYLSSVVTGNGTLAIYEGAGLIDTVTVADGYQTLKYTALQNPCNLRFVYTPGTGDTGGALLDGFEGAAGLIMLLR